MRHAGKDLQPILERIRAMEESLPDSLPNLLPYGCDKCDGYGNLIDETGARPCQCKLDYFREKELKRVSLPQEYSHMTFTNFRIKTDQQERLSAIVQKWVERLHPDENYRGLFLFSGKPGVGKTHIAVSAMKALIEKGLRGRFLTYHEGQDSMVKTAWDAINRREGVPFFLQRGFLEVDFVVIDDLGSGRQNVSEPIREAVSAFIRDCYTSHTTMLITSNFDLTDLSAQFDETITSRITAACHVLDCSNITDQRLAELNRIEI